MTNTLSPAAIMNHASSRPLLRIYMPTVDERAATGLGPKIIPTSLLILMRGR